MGLATKNLGGKSAKNFVKTQKTTADVEGHIQEIMNGEKVVKVFSHEPETIDRLTRSMTSSWLSPEMQTFMPIRSCQF